MVFTVTPAPRFTVVNPAPPPLKVAVSPVPGMPPVQFPAVAQSESAAVPFQMPFAANALCATQSANTAMEPTRTDGLRAWPALRFFCRREDSRMKEGAFIGE